jgi:hypothetical protein
MANLRPLRIRREPVLGGALTILHGRASLMGGGTLGQSASR